MVTVVKSLPSPWAQFQGLVDRNLFAASISSDHLDDFLFVIHLQPPQSHVRR